MKATHVNSWDVSTIWFECDECGFFWHDYHVPQMKAMGAQYGVCNEKPLIVKYSDCSKYLILRIEPLPVICAACTGAAGPFQFGGLSLSEYPGPGKGKGIISRAIIEGTRVFDAQM